jgi:hypothetical protein
VYYLVEYKPASSVSYYNDSWQDSNKFNNIKSIGLNKSDMQEYSILYEMLTATDHIWGYELATSELLDLGAVGCDQTSIVYDKFDNGFAAVLRSKETITSKPSSVIVSNYATYINN